MNKFNLLHYFFIFLAFLFLNENVAKSDYGTKKEKKGFQQIRQRRFDRLDLNNDKIVTQEEFELRNQKFFLEIDKNKDKHLTKSEMFKKRKKLRNILE